MSDGNERYGGRDGGAMGSWGDAKYGRDSHCRVGTSEREALLAIAMLLCMREASEGRICSMAGESKESLCLRKWQQCLRGEDADVKSYLWRRKLAGPNRQLWWSR